MGGSSAIGPAEVKEALKRAAEEEQRSLSAMAQFVLSGWLVSNGYLAKAKKSGKGR